MNMYVFVVSDLVSSTASNNAYSSAWRILGYPCSLAMMLICNGGLYAPETTMYILPSPSV